MPTEVQRTMDLTFAGISNSLSFIDNVFIVTLGTEEEHIEKIKEVLQRLIGANIILKIEKCNLAADNIEWVVYRLLQQGVEPNNSNIQGISNRLKPSNLKELRSYLGAVNQLNKFIPNLAEYYFPFRPLLKENNPCNSNKVYNTAFEQIKEELKKVTMLNHLKRHCPLRRICDAAKPD